MNESAFKAAARTLTYVRYTAHFSAADRLSTEVNIQRRLKNMARAMGTPGARFSITFGDTFFIHPENALAEAVMEQFEQYVIEKELQKG